MLDAVQITPAMIAAGREAVLRELWHPEREGVGPYKAQEMAEVVFRSMIAAKERVAECHDPAIYSDKTT